MKIIKGIFICAALFTLFASCSDSNIMARSEAEGLRKGYSDPELARLNERYQASLRAIYARFRLAGIDIYQEGIGFTKLSDNAGNSSRYLMILTRPKQITFDGNKTTPEQRFDVVFQKYFPETLQYAKREDLDKEHVDGLAFGVYWPVRDYTQCNTYGGFLEYAVIYMKKGDFYNLLNGTSTLRDAAANGEVVTSLGLKQPASIVIAEP